MRRLVFFVLFFDPFGGFPDDCFSGRWKFLGNLTRRRL
jgi:hypothetical protein